MKTALCTIAFKQKPIEAVLEMAGCAGFDGVEPWGRPPHVPHPYDGDPMRRIAEAVRSRGLTVSQYGSYANPLSDDFKQAMADALRAASDLRTDMIRVWAGRCGSKAAPEADWKAAIEGLRLFSDRAADQGVRLVLEMHNGYLSDCAAGSLRLVEEVDRANFRLNYQPNFTHDAARVLAEAAKAAPFVLAVHAQNYMNPGSNTRALVSEGFVDYPAVVRLLKDTGFDGYLEVEFVREEAPEQALHADAAALRSLCAA
jgi:sugar phosphate isomerase/epimerase